LDEHYWLFLPPDSKLTIDARVIRRVVIAVTRIRPRGNGHGRDEWKGVGAKVGTCPGAVARRACNEADSRVLCVACRCAGRCTQRCALLQPIGLAAFVRQDCRRRTGCVEAIAQKRNPAGGGQRGLNLGRWGFGGREPTKSPSQVGAWLIVTKFFLRVSAAPHFSAKHWQGSVLPKPLG
jgi:hypothetical protein